MDRARTSALDAWGAARDRKPLVLRGARQVGKSWLVRDWGSRRYAAVAEANLERRPEIAACFADNDPRATLRRLEAVLARSIPADGSVLLFLDEIQASPQVLAKLRWFAEELPTLPVIAAGSLLDIALADPALSMPVGRVTYLHLEPMGFVEFLLAVGDAPLAAWLRRDVTLLTIEAGTAMPPPLHDSATARYREWLLVGGMPAAVNAWREGRSAADVSSIHRDLLASLRDDFAKYASMAHRGRLGAVLASVPRQLGGKFVYRAADPDDRAEPLRRAVELLCRARVCHRVPACSARGVPLGADADERRFKLLHLDVGLACTSLGLDLRTIESAADVSLVNGGAVADQAVGQLLRLTFPANAEPALHWWQRDRAGAEAEVDYVVAHGSRVVPVEVRSGATGRLRSLHEFVAERGLDAAVRIGAAPPVVQPVDAPLREGRRVRYRLLSLPPYLTEELPRLLDEFLAADGQTGSGAGTT